MRAPLLAPLLAALCAAAMAGCSSSSDSVNGRPDADARLMLQGPVGALDAGVYLALERDYDQTEGVHLQVTSPFGSLNGIKALETGQVDLAVVDLHDLAIARDRGHDLVAVQAIVETPLAAVIGPADGPVGVPSTLSARRVLRAIAGPGAQPVKVGSRGLKALADGRVPAMEGFWATDGLAARVKTPKLPELRIDRAGGAPPYPELVLAVTRETLETDAGVVAATVRTLRRGYEGAITDPASGVSAVTGESAALDRALTARQLDAVSPSFVGAAQRFGELSAAPLAAWARWVKRVGIVKHAPDVAAMIDPVMSRTGESTDPN